MSDEQKTGQCLTYDIHPDGDVVLVLSNVDADLPPCLRDLQPDDFAGISDLYEQAGKKHTLRIKASSKHLTLASPYFARMLQSGFREGAEFQSTGFVQLRIEEHKSVAFLLLLLIMHVRLRLVPTTVSWERLVEMAFLVDYYVCHESVGVFGDLWVEALKDEIPVEPPAITIPFGRNTNYGRALEGLFASWVFGANEVFVKMTRYILLHSSTTIDAGSIPLPRAILDKLNTERNLYIQRLFNGLYALHANVAQGCVDVRANADDVCSAAVLGALTKHMMEMKLFDAPPPSPPFPGLRIFKLMSDCATQFQSPKVNGVGHSNCQLSVRVALLLKDFQDPEGFDIDDVETGTAIPSRTRAV